MLKMVCICDRCKKQFPAKEAKRIKFINTLSGEVEKKEIIPGFLKNFCEFLEKYHEKDYCPECVSEIKIFISQKGEPENENSVD